LNSPSSKTSKSTTRSYIAAKLAASPNMGAETSGCDVVLRFRYRGKSVSSALEVWRKYEVEVKVLRVKGPRIPSLSFRCDLFWESGYTDLCHALAARESNCNHSSSNIRQKVGESYYDSYGEGPGSTEEDGFVENRLGRDPGVHVCSEMVALMISVTNESSSSIILSRADSSSIGFPQREMNTLRVSKGVSAKFPILLPRLNRLPDICQRLATMTKFKWRSDIPGSEPENAQDTGGPMFPANCRVRQGILEIPRSCLKNIVDENPIFLSRICKAPCSIQVFHEAGSNTAMVGKPVSVSFAVEIAEWLSADLKDRTNCVLNVCCARKDSFVENEQRGDMIKENMPLAMKDDGIKSEINTNNEFIWIGQIRKSLKLDEISPETLKHRVKIMFLAEGDYFVSACLSLSGMANEDEDVKEVWWAEKAAKMSVSRST